MIYKYRSPYRPLPFSYLPNIVEFDYDHSDIGAWTPKTTYAFTRPIPAALIEQWDLVELK